MSALRLVLALSVLLLAVPPGAASAGACRTETFRDASYIVCSFDPSKDDIRIVWRDRAGRPFRTFDALAGAVENGGRSLRFAMNGGMYEEDLSPVGLHIENGKVLSNANTKTVRGRPSQIPNFYKKPNGVFYLGRGGAGVLTTERFLARKPRAAFATQSGPMLVIDGRVNPSFIVDSKDIKPRNGVCASRPTEVHFVMSRGSVSFYEFARFFRDSLKCADALFLDGGWAPGLYAPELRRNDPPAHGGYGPIIAVIE